MGKNEETITIKLGALKKIPLNKWAIALLIMVIIAFLLFSGSEKNNLTEREIKPLIEQYIKTELIPDENTVISNIREESGIYIVTVTINDESVPTYFTKDGKFITQGTSLINIQG